MAECKTREFTHHSRAITDRVFPDDVSSPCGGGRVIDPSKDGLYDDGGEVEAVSRETDPARIHSLSDLPPTERPIR